MRVGSGVDAKMNSLVKYYKDNWASSDWRKMWVRYERKSLPLGVENTTNRCDIIPFKNFC